MGAPELESKELQAVSRLMISEDFAFVIGYLERVRQDMTERSLLLEDFMCYRVQGGALVLKDILEKFKSARQTLSIIEERRTQPKPKTTMF